MSDVIVPVPVQMDFTKPLDVLFHCHQRIASNLETLRRSAEELRKQDLADYGLIFASIDKVLTHFSTAGVLHTEDEESSLFPRIRRYGDAAVSEVFEAVERLEIQHSLAGNIENSLNRFFGIMRSGESLDKNTADLFSDLSESLYDLYRPHIQIENEFVFPAAGQILSDDDLLAVGREMYQRRRPAILSVRSS